MLARSGFLLSVFCLTLFGTITAQGTLCAPPDSISGVGVVEGMVVESATQIPLGFAKIYLRVRGEESFLEARSGTSGRFRFCNVPTGSIAITGQLGQLGGLLGPLALAPGHTLEVSLELSQPVEESEGGSVTGVVREANTGDPIEGATVVASAAGRTTVSNELGRFTITSLPAGAQTLHATRLGYTEAAGSVDVDVGRTTEILIEMTTEAISLEPIKVVAVRRRIELPGLEDFERRFNSGWGQFILEQDIQKRSPLKLTQMLYETGVSQVGDGKAIYMRRTGCGPSVYIDGIRVTNKPRGISAMDPTSGGKSMFMKTGPPTPDPDASAEAEAAAAVNLIHPMDVRAVEIYRGPAETPGQYLDSNAKCGVILIWTRRGDLSGY